MDFVSKLSEHLKLFDQMTDRTGVNEAVHDSASGERELRNAVFRCASCTETGACESWLTDAVQGATPPDFCRNADLFRRLTAFEAPK